MSSKVTQTDPAQRPSSSRKPRKTHEAHLQDKVATSTRFPPASKPLMVKLIELFGCRDTTPALRELVKRVEASQVDFHAAYATFARSVPSRVLVSRFNDRLDRIADQHPSRKAVVDLIRDLATMLLGSPDTTVNLIEQLESGSLTTVEQFAQRYGRSALVLSSDKFRAAVESVNPHSRTWNGRSANGTNLLTGAAAK